MTFHKNIMNLVTRRTLYSNVKDLTKLETQVTSFESSLTFDISQIFNNIQINSQPLNQISHPELSENQETRKTEVKNEVSCDRQKKNSFPRYQGFIQDPDFFLGDHDCDPLKLLTDEKSRKKSRCVPKDSVSRTKQDTFSTHKENQGCLEISPIHKLNGKPLKKDSDLSNIMGRYMQDLKNNFENNHELPLDLNANAKLSDIPTLNNSKIADETFISQTVHLNYIKNQKKNKAVFSGKNIVVPEYTSNDENVLNTGVHEPVSKLCGLESEEDRNFASNNVEEFVSNETHNLPRNFNLDNSKNTNNNEEVEVHNIYSEYDSMPKNEVSKGKNDLEEYFSTEEDIQRFIEHDILKKTHNSTFLLESTTGFYQEDNAKTSQKTTGIKTPQLNDKTLLERDQRYARFFILNKT
jgi:hypothetical protein